MLCRLGTRYCATYYTKRYPISTKLADKDIEYSSIDGKFDKQVHYAMVGVFRSKANISRRLLWRRVGIDLI